MDESGQTLRTADPRTLLAARGLRASHQRLVILDYLLRHDTHPTVDRVHADLSPLIPTLSKTTVYNTLKALVTGGLVTEITIGSGEARYDVRDQSHAHLRCAGCGGVFDIPLRVAPEADIPAGFVVTDANVTLRGFCPDCRC